MQTELSICSLALIFFGGVTSEEMEPSPYFKELTDKTFNKVLSQNAMSLVMFLAPWCGHCQKLRPQVHSAAKMLQTSPYPVFVAHVDCTSKGKKTCRRKSITGYPTLKIFRGKKFWKEYDGVRTAKGIAEYMTNHAKPCPAEVKTEAHLEELASDDNAFVAFFKKGTKDNALKNAFLNLAEEVRGYLRMGISQNPELIAKHCPQHGVVFIRNRLLRSKFEPDEVRYAGEESKDALDKWMNNIKHGIVGLRTPANVRDFSPPVIIAYYDVDYKHNPKGTNYWRNRILKVARKYTHLYKFAISKKSDFPQDFASFGFSTPLEKRKEPIILARNSTGKFKLNETFTLEAFEKFMYKLVIGDASVYVRSAEKPPVNPKNPVKIVVASTFDEMVLDSGRDSFLLLHSSNHRESMEFEATWYDLADELEGENVDILKMDYTKNDVPKNFPVVFPFTLYWVPKNNKSDPIRYTGKAKYPLLLAYVCKTATVELKYRDRKGRLKREEL